MNSLLPADVAVQGAREVGPEFHARFSARYRRYRYLVLDNGLKTLLVERMILGGLVLAYNADLTGDVHRATRRRHDNVAEAASGHHGLGRDQVVG